MQLRFKEADVSISSPSPCPSHTHGSMCFAGRQLTSTILRTTNTFQFYVFILFPFFLLLSNIIRNIRNNIKLITKSLRTYIFKFLYCTIYFLTIIIFIL
jgi:hypothetical protein